MSITSARLLAHLCCTCSLLLLLAITFIHTVGATSPVDTRVNLEEKKKSSGFDSSWKKNNCHLNLTVSGQTLEAESSAYQQLGISQCEYTIHTPSGHFILLNFTGTFINSDMPVTSGEQQQQEQQQYLQEVVAETTTQFLESALAKAVGPSVPQSREKADVKSSIFQADREEEPFSGVSDSLGSNHHKSQHHHNKQNTSLSQRNRTNTSFHGELSHKDSLEDSTSESVTSDGVRYKSFSSPASKRTQDNGLKPNSASAISEQGEARGLKCNSKIIIEEVSRSTGTVPQIICWSKAWQSRLPLVFHYTVPIRITYVWDRHSQSGFSLDFRFLRPEELDCLFWCNSHLCLPKQQLCDGFVDCPDHSDEHSSLCTHSTERTENGAPQVLNVVVIIVSVIVGVIIALVLIFMISHIFCRNGLCRRREPLLQPPHSQSSEICRSPSGSMQESGQYEALLHQHPQRQTTVPDLMLVNSHHRQQLHHHQHLQQHCLDVEQQQQQQQNFAHFTHGLDLSQEQQPRPSSSGSEAGLLPDSFPVIGSMRCQRHKPPPQHKQQHLEHTSQSQQGKHKQPSRHVVNLDELYPPNIPISTDGEEGYTESQKALHSKQQLEQNWQMENELFRPPPNKTVYDRDSPPPPYSFSPPGARSLDSLGSSVAAVCVLRQARSSLSPQASPTSSRSHSLSFQH